VALIASLNFLASTSLAQPDRTRPNIVFVYADDMGIGDTSAYQDLGNNPDNYQIATPNIERLASMGTRFTDVHSASALCTASR
jgi:arylsulfatase A-like enzyme